MSYGDASLLEASIENLNTAVSNCLLPLVLQWHLWRRVRIVMPSRVMPA